MLGSDYMSANASAISGATPANLPELRKVSRVGGANLSSAGSGNKTMDSGVKLRKASPEALALMMANKKQNDAASNSSNVWVPGGKAIARDNSRTRKLFY